ncbi:MAG TPA: Ig-like domain-containing protein, partial [Trebonia sp.]|nr:Ig-like domain-containing protein [Trebonia sp.]
MAAIVAVGLTAPGHAARAAAQGLPGGTWGLAQAVNLTALIPAGSQLDQANIQAVSCTSPGNCTAIGVYIYATNGVTNEDLFALSETDGTWGTAAALTGVPGSVNLSCAAPGECAVGLTTPGVSGYGASYLIDESGGVWGQPQPVTIGTVGTWLAKVSCPAAGDCTAVGTYVDDAATGTALPFVMDSSRGTWDAPQEVPGFAGLSASAPGSGADVSMSVSCTSAGNCVAGGAYGVNSTDIVGRHEQPFLATEANGLWGQAQNVAGMATLNPSDSAAFSSVSCGGPGACTVMGSYDNVTSAGFLDGEMWVADESGGTWGPAQQVPAPVTTNDMQGEALSCPAPGFCVIAGQYLNAGYDTAFTATYAGGSWTTQDVPGLAASQSQSDAAAVSCAAPGYCTVVGEGALAGSGQSQSFLADEVNGTWENAQGMPGIPGGANGTGGVSCTAPGYCTAFAEANTGTTPFTLNEATASAVTLQASTPVAYYGQEGSETLTATVTSPAGGTPVGSVAIRSGSSPVCTITLASGSGTCTLAATQLPIGTAQLTATYNGNADYVVSASAAVSLTVVPPPSAYVPAGPVRVLDTRDGTGGFSSPVGAGKFIALQVAGQHGVPASGVTAVVLNVTATGGTASSFVTAYPDG